MLKWIKVRQTASTATSTSTTPTTTLSTSHRKKVKDDEAGVKVEVKKEEEDSGMEREDTVCNICSILAFMIKLTTSDLIKVRFSFSFL